ncbi:MAG: zinc ABC transporter substrate-binding protein [Thiohalocapsa sp.]|jgi:zinc transport system substrate-binding protein|nr:zinc ABC transporter substrate-binding protein [Thiohalocapsa sp.]MCG6943652.1 zinc ABC transporter substrate-binding protein [Thiohalocapsa sp.]
MLLWLLPLLTAIGARGATAAEPLDVFVSVLPIQTFVEHVGAERVQVHVMVQPGHSPATYEPTPRQIATLADAQLYFRVGVPFEAAWMKRITATNPDMPVVDLRDGLRLRSLEAHDHATEHGPDHDAEHAHEAMDAHVWTSPRLVRHMAVTIRDALTRLDPAGAAVYAKNQAAFDAELAALDQRLRAELSGLRGRSFLVYHPAWGYFADAYGLIQVPIEYEGKEPGARRLTMLIDQAHAEGARVILVQPQFNRRAAEQVARAIGGRVETVDPLATDYAATLLRLANIIRDAYGPADHPAAAETGERRQ